MESLIKATKNHEFPAAILVVISNDTSAPGINLAKNQFQNISGYQKSVDKIYRRPESSPTFPKVKTCKTDAPHQK